MVSSPTALIETVASTLVNLGYQPSRVKIERFGLGAEAVDSIERQKAMRMASHLFILLVVAAALIAAQPTCAYACSCRPPGTPAEERDQADAVFLGTVVDVKAPNEVLMGGGDAVAVTFKTATVWKGKITQRLVLTTPGSSASCGVGFEAGKDYIVYARISDGALSTTLCSRTSPVENAADDIAILGQGQTPEANLQTPSVLPNTSAAPLLEAIGSVELVLVGFGILAVGLGMRFNNSRGRNDRKGD